MEPGGSRDNGRYDIAFQVWRPAENVSSSGCYDLVGENAFLGVDLGERGLVCEAPPAGEGISFRPGDVVGFRVDHKDEGDRGVQIQDGEGYSSEEVWYQEGAAMPTGDPGCMYPVGEGRTLQTFTNHAPVLSVTVGQSTHFF